jgi:hypothetical protein
MSQAVEVTYTSAVAKARRPWVVAILCVVTLGVYAWVWYYTVNREMRDFGSARADRQLAESNPRRSLLAITVGGLLVIPPFISLARMTGRVQNVQRLAFGTAPSRSGLVALVVCSQLLRAAALVHGAGVAFAVAGAVGIGLAFGLMQAQLNWVWGNEHA